jgi:AraC-like DNA-binding protein
MREAGNFYWFTLPFAWVAQWRLPGEWMNALLHGEVLSDDLGDGDEISCARWHLDLQNGDGEEMRAAQLEMEARLRRMARRKFEISPAAASPGSNAVQQSDAVQQIAETVARNYARALSVAEIVAPTGLHPNYAMALFRSTCGLSVGDYVLQHRLFHARRLLLTTDLKILDVALDSGFGSLSRFYEAFTRANGCSPQKFRRQTPRQK